MRLIETVEHPKFKVAIHAYNDKYIVNVTLDDYEQVFKIKQADVDGVNSIKEALTEEFYLNCMRQFLEMRKNWLTNLKNTL